MTEKFQNIETKIIHAGDPKPTFKGAVSIPIFQSSTFEYRDKDKDREVKYIRLSNTPNHTALHKKLAALENAESSLVTASGMAAIATTLITALSPGDHFLALDCLYGGTKGFITNLLSELKVSHSLISGNQPETWKSQCKSNTRVIYVETITNPLLQVPDLESLADFARDNNLISIIDNTFASPVNFRPPEFGFDLSLHSCTKYLNGHSDIVGGAVIGKSEWIDKIRQNLKQLGGSMDPHVCFLLYRGIKTLALRVRAQNKNALKIAQFLESHHQVKKVNYPGLQSHPQHDTARHILDGFGGMISFELKGGLKAAQKFMDRVQLAFIAPSLGGVETLLTRPVMTSHRGLSPEEKARSGISDSLIRVSVGIENPDDIIADFNQSLH
ncbi:MAG: aminotransferase class I/II-fold pyridoxal phosphate-dependent enzyme [Candidatus Aminicenantes bacterium]|nr:aminotransferase class I/II-fold pyridoxal phosphate-dependent enzyme [Candidatus Aminicenantes bacterium]